MSRNHSKVFDWQEQLDAGELGQLRVIRQLRSHGYAVEDVSHEASYQRQDIDALVDGKTVEIKTDTHNTGNVFLEVNCDGKPGCFLKSRAEYWLYYVVPTGKLWTIPLAEVQLFLLEHLSDYRKINIRSGRGRSRWQAYGYAVPLVDLKAAGVNLRRTSLGEEYGELYKRTG